MTEKIPWNIEATSPRFFLGVFVFLRFVSPFLSEALLVAVFALLVVVAFDFESGDFASNPQIKKFLSNKYGWHGSPPNPGVGNSVIETPNLDRHCFERINMKTKVKPSNSVAAPGIDISQESLLLRQGYGTKLGNDIYKINGREYKVIRGKQNRVYFSPSGGKNVINMNQGEFKAFRAFKEFGDTVKARDIIQTSKITPTESEIKTALSHYKKHTP